MPKVKVKVKVRVIVMFKIIKSAFIVMYDEVTIYHLGQNV